MEINQGLMKLYVIFLRQVSIPFVQMINCKMRQLARCGVANMLKVLATLRRNKHA